MSQDQMLYNNERFNFMQNYLQQMQINLKSNSQCSLDEIVEMWRKRTEISSLS